MKPDVLGVANFLPFYFEKLRNAFTLHDRLHANDPQAFAKVAPQIQAIAASGESKVGADLMDQLPALKLISVFGVGYDGIDVKAAQARGIAVTNTPDVLTDEVADVAIALMLATSRRLVQADNYLRAGRWASQGPFPLQRKMSGAHVGIVGLGRIGRAIAQRCEAFGMQIAYCARTKKDDVPYAFHSDTQTLAAAVDYLVVATFGGPTTRNLINAKVLEALGPDGILVNIARGSVVDEPALIEALTAGRIAGAGLDVFADEPNVPAELIAMDNVTLLPHVGSATTTTRLAMGNLAFGNLEAHFAGKPLLTPVSA